MKTITYPIPLYFNYIGTMHHLLAKAIESITHSKIKVCINAVPHPVPFTKCLNNILAEVNTPCFFFMHYDAVVTDQSVFDKILDLYENSANNVASVSICNITDLLVLYDTKLIRQIGGWDENFKNSYMELDLRRRIYNNCLHQPIIYNVDCPPEIIHKDASSLRNPTIDGNITYVYDESYKKDAIYYYNKYADECNENIKEFLSKEMRFSTF